MRPSDHGFQGFDEMLDNAGPRIGIKREPEEDTFCLCKCLQHGLCLFQTDEVVDLARSAKPAGNLKQEDWGISPASARRAVEERQASWRCDAHPGRGRQMFGQREQAARIGNDLVYQLFHWSL